MSIRQILEDKAIVVVLAIYGLFVSAVIVCCLTWAEAEPEGCPAQDFALEDIFGGEVVSYSKHKGNPVILYFFASW